jgi:hypothetical protein
MEINPEGGTGYGYDMEFIDENGHRKYVEVKTTKNNKMDFLYKISERNEIMIEKKQSSEDSARRIKMIYTWAQKNGYNEIWIPGKVRA